MDVVLKGFVNTIFEDKFEGREIPIGCPLCDSILQLAIYPLFGGAKEWKVSNHSG